MLAMLWKILNFIGHLLFLLVIWAPVPVLAISAFTEFGSRHIGIVLRKYKLLGNFGGKKEHIWALLLSIGLSVLLLALAILIGRWASHVLPDLIKPFYDEEIVSRESALKLFFQLSIRTLLNSRNFWEYLIAGLTASMETALISMAYSDIAQHANFLWKSVVLHGKSNRLVNVAQQKPVNFLVEYSKDGHPVIIAPLKDKQLPAKYKKLNEKNEKEEGDPGSYAVKTFAVAPGPRHTFVWGAPYVIFSQSMVLLSLVSAPLWFKGNFSVLIAVWIALFLGIALWIIDITILNKAVSKIVFVELLDRFKEHGKEKILQLADFLKRDKAESEIFELTMFEGESNPFLSLAKEQVNFDICYLTTTAINIFRNMMVNVRYYAFEESNSFLMIPFDSISAIDFDGRKLAIDTSAGRAYEYNAGSAAARRTAMALADRLRESYRRAHMQISTMNYEEALEYINKLVNYERKSMPKVPPDLNEFRDFLAKIENPHLKLKNPILVVGTKGKGSTAAHLAAILASYGYKVGLYTSPHLRQPVERIKIVKMDKGKLLFEEIAGDEFATYISRIHRFMPKKGGMRTYFELLTAIAFLYFNDQGVDYSVIEAGLGGKYDATNVVEQVLTVITPISYDHVHILGPDLASIVEQKVDVIKKRRDFPLIRVVLGEQIGEELTSTFKKAPVRPRTVVIKGLMNKLERLLNSDRELNFHIGFLYSDENYQEGVEETLEAIKNTAIPTKILKKRVKLYPARFNYSGLFPLSPDGIIPGTKFQFEPPRHNKTMELKTGLAGKYQAHNASLAMLAAYVLDIPRKTGKNPSGTDKLTSEHMPGRFQIVRKYDPLMIVDGAHNDFAIREFLGALKEYIDKMAAPNGKYGLFLVFGSNEDKDYHAMIESIFKSGLKLEKIYFTSSGISRAETPNRLLEAAQGILVKLGHEHKRDYFKRMETEPKARTAFDRAFDDAILYEKTTDNKSIMVVTGSFYLAGEAVEWNYEFLVGLP